MNSGKLCALLAWVLGLLAAVEVLALVRIMGNGPLVVQAQSSNIRYVALTGANTGNDCTHGSSPCRTVQYAIDQAHSGEEIRVAGGVFSGANLRKDVTQTVYISKSMIIRGGFTTTNWTAPDPTTNPTTLDAQKQGRVLYITGDISTTIEGLRITNGDAAGMGGGQWGDSGGGIYVLSATLTMSNCQVSSNTALIGGGIYLSNSHGTLLMGNVISDNDTLQSGGGAGLYQDSSARVTLMGNTISNNEAGPSHNSNSSGGGAVFENSPEVMLRDNMISYNRATVGGGVKFSHSHTATLVANTIRDNTASHIGGNMKHVGGILFTDCDNATLIGNTISNNHAVNTCGGACFSGSDNAMLVGNNIFGNTAGEYGRTASVGGGLEIAGSFNAVLIGNTIINNHTNTDGGGLWVSASTITLTGNTISANEAMRGGGLFISGSDALLSSNIVIANTVHDYPYYYDYHGIGGGLFLSSSTNKTVTLINTVIADNQAETAGSGLWIQGGRPQLLHTTIARNSGGDGSGVYITGTTSTVAMANTILMSHTVGVTATAGNRVALNSVLWHSNTTNTGGVGYITVTQEYTGDPAFAADGYHLTSGSAAIGKGVNAGVDRDIDGDPRPLGDACDLGSDEFAYHIYLPMILRLDTPPTSQVILNSMSPSLQLLGFQPSGDGYLFTVRLGNALSHTQYVITSYHHTDIDYPQSAITVTTDSAGVASARVWSRCRHQGVLTGTVFAQLQQSGMLRARSNQLSCPALRTVGDFGSHLTAQPANDDWIYRPSPPGPDRIRIWVRDAAGQAGLTGAVNIRSAGGYSLPERPLADEGGGLYSFEWSIAGLPRADDYRVQMTLSDALGGLSGLDAFVKLTGRAMWVWGEKADNGNPAIWALLTNADYDGNGMGDRDEWLAHSGAPYGVSDPYATTSYLSVYPYISYTGTLLAGAFQSFLTAAHAQGEIRVEALAGTHEWVETDAGLQDGKDLCDAILDLNRAGAGPAKRFDGIHFDVEHDDWYVGARWSRYLDLITYCQAQVSTYNQTREPIVFGVDLPPHFLTGSGSSGAVMSAWDVLSIVDYITLMDYRDYADVRWDGRTDGIISQAEDFIADGNALGKPVIIGVELTPNPYNHVTFFEECPMLMERELRKVARYLAGAWAFKGIAIHDFGAWKGKSCVFLPVTLKNDNS